MARLPPRLALAALAFAAAGPAAAAREEVVPIGANPGWRGAATEADRDRVRHWRDAWIEALARPAPAAKATRSRAAALCSSPTRPWPAPRRRPATMTAGRSSSARGAAADCPILPPIRPRSAGSRATGRRLRFTRLTGPQRPVGAIFPDNGRRMVFLGTLDARRREPRAPLRARPRARPRRPGRAGRPEPLADRLPAPHFESLLDVIELIPRR